MHTARGTTVEAQVNYLTPMAEKPYPAMAPDEAVLIKTYDSCEDGRARFTAHTSFDEPNTPSDAAPRESIEIRALVFYPS